VDVCREHGTWFDKDELRRIVEFIRAGGLEQARADQIAELERKGQQLRAGANRRDSDGSGGRGTPITMATGDSGSPRRPPIGHLIFLRLGSRSLTALTSEAPLTEPRRLLPQRTSPALLKGHSWFVALSASADEPDDTCGLSNRVIPPDSA